MSKVIRPIRQLAGSFAQVATGEGDLTVRLDDKRRDEIGEVTKYFNVFIENVQKIIKVSQETAQQVKHLAEILSRASDESSRAVEQVAIAIQEVAEGANKQNENMRNLQTTSGDVTLKVPKLKGIPFETAIIERYRRRESSVEEALIEMYLAGVSVRRVEDITEALWGSKVSPGTISNLNKKAYEHIEAWRNRPLPSEQYPYVFIDGIYLKRSWGGEFENVAILVAIAVNQDGYREVIGAAEGMKEDKEGWRSFLVSLRNRGLKGVQLVVGDKCQAMCDSVTEVFPEAKYQRCSVHFFRNIFSVVPRKHAGGLVEKKI